MKLFAISMAARWGSLHEGLRPALSSFVDDIYGGILNCNSYELALSLRDDICKTGARLTYIFNMKPNKTPLPSQRQVILGCLYDSTCKRMRSSERKIKKYVARIDELLLAKRAQVSTLMSIHGNLNFVANAAPFGRPFLALLSNLLIGRQKSD